MSSKLLASIGVAMAHLRYYRVRTVLVVIAIALAVLSMTLLVSVGVGVKETGTQKFASADRDLWMSGGPTRLTATGVENQIGNAHRIAANLSGHPHVESAEAIAYQSVYVGTDPSDLRQVIGVGVNGPSPSMAIIQGQPIRSRDAHFAGGSYDGPMTYDVVVGPRVREQFNLSIGDTLHVGGTVTDARKNQFEVVGVSPTLSRFLGAPTVFLLLSELQEVTGTTGTDRATQITISLSTGSPPPAVMAKRFQQRFPDYRVRTNREQFDTILENQVHLLIGGGLLIAMGIIAGVTLTINALLLMVYHQRTSIAALKIIGIGPRTLGSIVVWQAILIGIVGAMVGVVLTPPAVEGLNRLAGHLIGFEGLVVTPIWVYGAGVGVAVGIGLIGALVASWRVVAIRPLEVLH